MDSVETIIVLYKIKDTSVDNKEVSYSVGYVNIKPKESSVFFDNDINVTALESSGYYGHLYINNICISGSVTSKDGEYRPTLIYWMYVYNTIQNNRNLSHLFKDIQEYFIKKLQYRKYLIYCRYIFPTDAIRNKYSFELELMASNKKIDFFCISWFTFYYSYIFDILTSHLNNTYKDIMLKYRMEDLVYFYALIDKYSINVVHKLYHLCNNNIRSTEKNSDQLYLKTKLGQKIIPVSLREIQNPFMILYKPWKEYLIGLRLTKLVINNVSPGFPIMTNWIFIKNPDEHLYDNPSQAERIKKSVLSRRITDILYQAGLLSQENILNKDNIQFDLDSNDRSSLLKLQKKAVSSWLSREFRVLNNKVKDAMDHANEHIAMSNVSFCMYTEYVGKTLYESIFITSKSKFYKSVVSLLFSTEGYPYFEKYMFELCYNLLCLSEKCGIIHSDLHLHNLTLNSLFYKSNVNTPQNPKVMYILNNKSYVFDTNFYNLSLIDFSRSIIDPARINEFKDPTIHKMFNIINEQATYEQSQSEQLFNYLISCKPEYKEFGLYLQMTIQNQISTFFKILSVLDLYMVTNRFINFFKIKKDLNYQPYSGCINLIKQINIMVDIYLTKSLDKIIHHKELLHEFDLDEWPILTINNIYIYLLKINLI